MANAGTRKRTRARKKSSKRKSGESDGNDDAGPKAKDTFVEALRSVLNDDSFKIMSSEAIEARKAAQILLDWCLDAANNSCFTTFVLKLSEDLKQAISSCKKKSCNREKLWRNFFLLRSSEKFREDWVNFLDSANVAATPILYQHLTDILFRGYIGDHVTGCTAETKVDPAPAVTKREGNALRYAAGYVCRHLRKKIERSKHELKEEMVLCLMALTKDTPEEHSECGSSEEWTLALDREEEVRECLKMLLGSNPAAGKKEEIVEKVISSDDVEFYWLISTADFEIGEKEVHSALLKEIVQLYVTIRGFSYASFWMEKFKQSAKKSTQRSKSLRRDLYDSSL
ncbi:uncharacterized protein [Dysidea avara]|uniref:uncharacterized protein isoform X2 n=1 Tax=Dysidea avara TaxID=196820 RepID=UPI00332B763D